MKIEDILICITNHNSNENAINLKDGFRDYAETIIIDSASDLLDDNFDIKLDNVYYSGLVNECINQTISRNKKYLFFIASDVYFDNYINILDIIKEIDDDIYVWSPSSKGQSHYHCKNFNTNYYREVPYIEGFCFLSNIECLKPIYPISLDKNLYGYGIDLLIGFFCYKLRKKCVVDDRVEIYHKEGTGYNQNKALNDMYNWMLNDFNNEVKDYTILYSKSWDPTINSSDYKKLLNYLKNG